MFGLGGEDTKKRKAIEALLEYFDDLVTAQAEAFVNKFGEINGEIDRLNKEVERDRREHPDRAWKAKISNIDELFPNLKREQKVALVAASIAVPIAELIQGGVYGVNQTNEIFVDDPEKRDGTFADLLAWYMRLRTSYEMDEHFEYKEVQEERSGTPAYDAATATVIQVLYPQDASVDCPYPDLMNRIFRQAFRATIRGNMRMGGLSGGRVESNYQKNARDLILLQNTLFGIHDGKREVPFYPQDFRVPNSQHDELNLNRVYERSIGFYGEARIEESALKAAGEVLKKDWLQ